MDTGLERERQHLGIGRGLVLAAEGFDTGLQKFTNEAAALAEYRPKVAEADGLTGPRGLEVVARHRDREVRP